MFYVLFCHHHFSDTVRKFLLNQTKPMLKNLNQNTLTSPRKGINITFFLLTSFISFCMWICVTCVE